MNRLLEYCKGDKVYTMERLTTRNIAGVAVYKHPFECERCGETIWRLPDYGNGSPTEKLADYEDAEEQGFNDVWFICDKGTKYATVMSKSINDLTVYEIRKIDKDGRYWSSKKKAEAKLAEMEGREND